MFEWDPTVLRPFEEVNISAIEPEILKLIREYFLGEAEDRSIPWDEQCEQHVVRVAAHLSYGLTQAHKFLSRMVQSVSELHPLPGGSDAVTDA